MADGMFFTQVVDPMREWFLSFGMAGAVAWIVLKILLIAMPVIITVAFYVVWERKLIGWMHVRHGPMYVGFGILQAFADVFKLLFKEVIQPTAAHKVLFVLAPLVTLAPAFAAWAVVPVRRRRNGNESHFPFQFARSVLHRYPMCSSSESTSRRASCRATPPSSKH